MTKTKNATTSRLERIQNFIVDELERREQACLSKTDPYMAEARNALADVINLMKCGLKDEEA